MGYDMHWKRKPDGEEQAQADASREFHAAVEVRDALPKGSGGRHSQEERLAMRDGTLSWEAIPANATEEFKVAQAEVSRTYDAMYATERSYFRLNIFGMGNVRDAMAALGAGYWHDEEHPAWPEAPEGYWEWDDDDVAAPIDPENKRLFERVRAHYEACQAWAPGRSLQLDTSAGQIALTGDPTQPGIPLHKFCSNDGWHVLPEEAYYAAQTIRAAAPEDFTKALDAAGITGEDWLAHWARWVQWLADSADHGGFEVH